MSDQPNSPATTPAAPTSSAQSLDDILNQLEKTAGTGPSPTAASTSVPIPMPTTPAPAPSEPTPPPILAEAAPVMPSEPVSAPTPPESQTPALVSSSPPEPPPVATLSEAEIKVPEPLPPVEPAPMVTETPGLSPAPAPATEPTPFVPAANSTPETIPAAPTTPPPKKGGKGKIVAGIIGVLFLVGAAGAGVVLTQQTQETRSPAATPVVNNIPRKTASAVPTAVPTPASPTPVTVNLDTARVTGKICIDKVSSPGIVLIFNQTAKVMVAVPIAQSQTDFVTLLPVGNLLAYYTSSTNSDVAGYTDAGHNLKTIVSSVTNPPAPISLCDTQAKVSGIDQSQYSLYQGRQ